MEILNVNNGETIRVLNEGGRYRAYTTFFLRNRDTLQAQLETAEEDGENALADIIDGFFYTSQNLEMVLSHPYVVLCKAMHHNGEDEILVLQDSIDDTIFLVCNGDRYIAKGIKLSDVKAQMDNVFIQLNHLESLINRTGAECGETFDELNEKIADILNIYSDYISLD
jgi:hypothetical protein